MFSTVERGGWHAIRAGLYVLALGVWEGLVQLNVADPFYVSSPVRIGIRTIQWIAEGQLAGHILTTLCEALIGLGLGVFLGILLAGLLVNSRVLRYIIFPMAIASNAIPKYALAPLFILWFGLGYASKVAMVTAVVFFAIFITSYEGMRQSHIVLYNQLRLLGANRWQMIFHLALPSAMPWFLNGLRMAIGFSISAAVISEYLGASRGLGFLIENSQSFFDGTGVMTGLFILICFALPVDGLLRRWISWVLRWQEGNVPGEGLELQA